MIQKTFDILMTEWNGTGINVWNLWRRKKLHHLDSSIVGLEQIQSEGKWESEQKKLFYFMDFQSDVSSSKPIISKTTRQ